jgi:putative membrane protein
MQILRSALAVSKLESRLFSHFPKLRVSVLGIIFIPALYAFIYLNSVWDPATHTGNLPAAIVNLDQGTQVGEMPANLGAEVVRALKDKRQFAFYETADADAARRDVQEGKSLFALILPPDFSASALSAASPGAGRVEVYASEGNNYAGAGFAKRFADELGHQLNETLNEKRWAAVLGATASSSDGLKRLREGVAKLREGAVTLDAGMGRAQAGSKQLASGAGELSAGVVQLADGVKQLGAGARTLDAKKPSAEDLGKLKSGAAQLATGHAQLEKVFPQLEDGARKLAEGAGQLRQESSRIPVLGGKVSGAAGQLAEGAGQLRAGIAQVEAGEAKLSAGSLELSKAVAQTADGFAAYAGGVSTLASRFPADTKLDQLAGGGQSLADASGQLHGGLSQLKTGSAQLAAGLVTLESSLPAGAPSLPGTAGGLAHSVKPQLEINAPVKNNGMGLAPNFIPVSLWLGAVMTAFIFHLRRLPQEAAGMPRASLLLGKLGILWSINLAQAACVFLMAWLMLGIEPVNSAGLALTMVLSSFTFMLVILALVRAFGDAGKAVALILLVLQLSAAGGVMPVELTSDFYRSISPWLPFTWAIKGVRASAFGALGGDWGAALGVLAIFAGAAFAICMVVGRWKFVGPQEHRPAMDI